MASCPLRQKQPQSTSVEAADTDSRAFGGAVGPPVLGLGTRLCVITPDAVAATE
jgi:hypothetical protein